MQITLSWQTVITAGAVIAAMTTIITLLVRLTRWIDRQKKQDTDIKEMRHELTVICYGLRGALQGLIESGCNGPCKDALQKLDKHLNQSAHDEVSS